jgi:hypothetical protein
MGARRNHVPDQHVLRRHWQLGQAIAGAAAHLRRSQGANISAAMIKVAQLEACNAKASARTIMTLVRVKC